MRQVLILRIHTNGRLVATSLLRSQCSLEGVVVAFVTNHFQRFNRENALLAVLVDEDVDLLKCYCIVETLLVDNILQRILLRCADAC